MLIKRWLAGTILLLLLWTGCALADATPSAYRCGKAHCFWETPMDITDTQAVWQMLIQPMTVVKGHQRQHVELLAQPSEDADPVGEVTCKTQGVHVLQTLDNGWSLVECYSSCDGGSRIRVYGDLVQGYIPTDQLTEIPTKTKYALVVDKLTQRMHVFAEGELLSTLRISTGLAKSYAPQDETCAGEFHLANMVGSYDAGYGIICEYAIRFNDGDLIHGVPYAITEDGRDYWRFENQLGRKVSGGCIRVQRRRSPEGINMIWLWNRLFDQKQSRIVIWEDTADRQLPIPAPDSLVYVAPGLSGAYHLKPECYSVDPAWWPFEPITYAQLEDEPYRKLSDCYYCNPPLRQAALEAINQGSRTHLEMAD